MFDQLKICNKASFYDFGASLASREIKPPKKKSIKETVPFSNITYDFSAINGELYWDERTLKYVFEIIADNPESLERKKIEFSKWVMNIMNENIYDPYEPDYHYVGTFDDLEYSDEDCVEKTTATVTFSAYPYKIANKATNRIFVVPAASEKVIAIFNDSAHRITPTITTESAIVVSGSGDGYAIPAGSYVVSALALNTGANTFTIQNPAEAECKVVFSFYEEVF